MKLFLISQNINNGFGTYNSAVVVAESEDAARMIHPRDTVTNWDGKADEEWDEWIDAKDVEVCYLGEALDEIELKIGKIVICASYNDG